MVYNDPENILVSLYFSSQEVTRDGEFVYTPFPTLQHMQHEAFVYALQYNYLPIYEYQVGEYMPYCEKVEQSIKDNFIYNPVFDCYDIKDWKIGSEFIQWMHRNPKTKTELNNIRVKSETFSAKELYVILFEHEKEYIKNFNNIHKDPNKLDTEVDKIINGLRYSNIHNLYRSTITEEKYDKISESFENLILGTKHI